ncbi:MAG TPA: hypothetical protein VM422_11680, partial [Amaricoccus sp.]|nr:hypothetical protein [Amaricoccus sp.]
SMEAEFHEASGGRVPLQTVLAEGAMDALRRGDGYEHNRLVAEAAAALAATQARVRARVTTAPHAAVARLRARLAG